MSNLIADPPASAGDRPRRAIARDLVHGLAVLATSVAVAVVAVHQSLYTAVGGRSYEGGADEALLPFLGWTAALLWIVGVVVALRAVHELVVAGDEQVVPPPAVPVEPTRVVLPESEAD